jgi:hypothetical protein
MAAKALIAFAIVAGLPALAAADTPPVPALQPPAAAAPADYRCPTTAYLNCMPPISDDRRASCAKDYVAWVQLHCPNTQVVY